MRSAGKAGTLRAVSEEPLEELVVWRPGKGHLPETAWFGIPTRRGGVSLGPYASLNLGLEVGDERESVLRNRAIAFGALGIPGPGPLRLHQVHGTRIVEPDDAPCEADGFIVRAGDPWVAVSAADCAPVALVARSGARGALLHSGWRGTRGRIAARAVRLLAARGVPVGEILASIGPCIHACCYPIGPEIARDFPGQVLKPHAAGTALDLPLAISLALRAEGVREDAILVAQECTSCEAGSFYSHRRDRGVTGRHWALFHLATAE